MEARLRGLLRRMTPEEKVAQLQGYDPAALPLPLTPRSTFVEDADAAAAEEGPRRTVTNAEDHPEMTPRDQLARFNSIQRYLVEKTRLGIPAFLFEALHGHMGPGATNFPVPIALGGTWGIRRSSNASLPWPPRRRAPTGRGGS